MEKEKIQLSGAQEKAARILYGKTELLDDEARRMQKLILSSKADGTLVQYCDSIRKWKEYAKKKKFQEFPIRKKDFSAYITNLDKWGTPFSFLKTLLAAIPFWYAARNCDEIVVTKEPFVKLLVEGAMRSAAKRKGNVSKVETIEEGKIKEILRKTFWPYSNDSIPNSDKKAWRIGVRLYTYYKSFCRFDCYKRLGPTSFKFENDHVKINFPKAKNDQMYQGSMSIIASLPGDKLCPKLVYKTYFDVMGFKGIPEEIMNCRFDRRGQVKRSLLLSQSSSSQETKEFLKSHGLEGKFSEKSLKASGVTTVLDKGAPLVDVQIAGRWKGLQTPLFYHNSSIERRAAISKLT